MTNYISTQDRKLGCCRYLCLHVKLCETRRVNFPIKNNNLTVHFNCYERLSFRVREEIKQGEIYVIVFKSREESVSMHARTHVQKIT